jgi:hypothetical protein
VNSAVNLAPVNNTIRLNPHSTYKQVANTT